MRTLIGRLDTLPHCFVIYSFLVSSTRADDADCDSFPWSLNHQVPNLDSIYCRAAAAMTGILTAMWGSCRRDAAVKALSDDKLLVEYPVGRLGFKDEGASRISGKNLRKRVGSSWAMLL